MAPDGFHYSKTCSCRSCKKITESNTTMENMTTYTSKAKHKIIKATTTHYVYLKCREDMVHIAVDQYLAGNDRFSLYDGIEPCSGVLRHWGSKSELRAELMELVQILDVM